MITTNSFLTFDGGIDYNPVPADNLRGNLSGGRRSPDQTLMEVLREDLGLTDVKHGCDDSNCGVCRSCFEYTNS